MLGIFRAVPFTCALLSQCDLDLESHTVVTNCPHSRALRQGPEQKLYKLGVVPEH